MANRVAKELIALIRLEYERTDKTLQDLADEYGVSKETVFKYKKKQMWERIEPVKLDSADVANLDVDNFSPDTKQAILSIRESQSKLIKRCEAELTKENAKPSIKELKIISDVILAAHKYLTETNMQEKTVKEDKNSFQIEVVNQKYIEEEEEEEDKNVKHPNKRQV